MQFVKTRQETRQQSFSNNYQNIDVLIIDDVQKLAGKAGTINFFFNIFNSLIDRGKQIFLPQIEHLLSLVWDLTALMIVLLLA